MKKLLVFIRSRTFLKHFSLALGTIALLIMIVFWSLSAYTDHGEYIPVPDFNNVRIQDLDAFVEGKDVRYRIIDSVYDDKKEKGVVVRQDPEANTEVKHNRIIYLYVTATVPQQVTMPNLVDASPRQAVALLEAYGLKLKRTVKKPGPSAVLAQLYKGKPIAAGTNLPKGSEIELWIGKGEEDEVVGIPCIDGLSLEDAVTELTSAGLSPGAVICKGCKSSADTLKARVFRQSPPCGGDNMVTSGSSVDIFLTLDIKSSNDDSVKVPVPEKKGK